MKTAIDQATLDIMILCASEVIVKEIGQDASNAGVGYSIKQVEDYGV